MAAARNPFDDMAVRIRVLLVFMLLGFGLLALAMWRIQVAHGDEYQQDLVRQSVRRVRLPGSRGRIFDRQGRCLADNRPSYAIAIYLEELRRPGGTVDRVNVIVDRLAQVLEIPREITREDIARHVRRRLPLPLLAWRDVDENVLARFSERASLVPGVDVYVQALRMYPEGALACHILGHVGRAELTQAPENPYHYFIREMDGRTGIEGRFDGVLRGEAGVRLVRVDVSGFRHEDLGGQNARSGSDVLLTIDTRVQWVAEQVLGDEPGAVVVLDPRNGDVLAMASSPRFDPNSFVPAISSEAWALLRDDERDPLVNRAVAGTYAPGSIFKPVVAMTALENDLANGQSTFNCPGFFELGDTRFRCWTRGQHGDLAMREALKRSCNVYFYRLGLQCKHKYIYHMAAALGLGAPTGISLPSEASGILPDSAWMRQAHGHGWRAGDTCNFSIGQGDLTVTPLQMALVTATIANGGHVYRPRLVQGIRRPGEADFRGIPPTVMNEMNWSNASLSVVRGGMHDVVMSERGTGRLAAVEGITMAGKTGTAEYGPKSQGKKRGWMIAYAPFEEPRYAVAVVVEDAISGGVTAAPMIKRLMTHLLGRLDPMEGQG